MPARYVWILGVRAEADLFVVPRIRQNAPSEQNRPGVAGERRWFDLLLDN